MKQVIFLREMFAHPTISDAGALESVTSVLREKKIPRTALAQNAFDEGPEGPKY